MSKYENFKQCKICYEYECLTIVSICEKCGCSLCYNCTMKNLEVGAGVFVCPYCRYSTGIHIEENKIVGMLADVNDLLLDNVLSPNNDCRCYICQDFRQLFNVKNVSGYDIYECCCCSIIQRRGRNKHEMTKKHICFINKD